MENEIKVGDYVRLKKGEIFKIDENTTNYYNSNKEFMTNDVVKHSPNLIDIIEERRLCKWAFSNRHSRRWKWSSIS